MNTAQCGHVVSTFAEMGRLIAGAASGQVVDRSWDTYQGGANGGFLLDQELIAGVWDKARAIDGPLARCLFLTTTKNSATWPAFRETSRASGSRLGGMTARWQGRTDDQSLDAFASRPALNANVFRPRRVLIFSEPFSNDLLADAPLVERMMEYAARLEINYAVVDSMINGDGATRPQGVLGAPSTITLGSRASAGTIGAADVDGMWSRLWGFCRRNAVWICNDDTLLKIDQAATTSGWPPNMYMPQGYGGNPFPLLKGRPLLPVEQCAPLGASGDLILGDWSQYALVARIVDSTGAPDLTVSYGGVGAFIEQTSSDQFYFDTDSYVFRFKLRIDGQTLWRSPVLIADGSQTAGPFVVLP